MMEFAQTGIAIVVTGLDEKCRPLSLMHACRRLSIPSFFLPFLVSFMSALVSSFIVSRILQGTCFVGCYLSVPKPSAYSFFCRNGQIPHLASGPSLAPNLYQCRVWIHLGTLECHIELGLLALLSSEAQAGHKVICFSYNNRFCRKCCH